MNQSNALMQYQESNTEKLLNQIPLSTQSDKIKKMLKIPDDAEIKKPRRKKHGVVDFMMMKTDEVLDLFGKLPGAARIGKDDKQFVYIPGTRKDKALLVAHSDTVWKEGDEDIELGYYNGTYFSLKEKTGIGADDRAGITMLWKLRSLGHSLLIPNMEERGCIGSRYLMTMPEWRKIINEHHFAIEMDRCNDKDLVFYRVGTQEMGDWAEDSFTGYKKQQGSFTDIGALCDTDEHKEDALPGMNISVGYYNQHFDSEFLVESEWQRTLGHLHRVLSQKDLPKFRQKYHPKPTYIPPVRQFSSYNNYNNSGVSGSGFASAILKDSEKKLEITESLLCCPECQAMFDESEYTFNGNACTYCNHKFD